MDLLNDIERLAKLKDDGHLTDREFNRLKKRLLPSSPDRPPTPPARANAGKKGKAKKSLTVQRRERLTRAVTEGMRCNSAQIMADNAATFLVHSGKSTNDYRVDIREEPTCTCADHKYRNTRCKHILYILNQMFKQNFEPAHEAQIPTQRLEGWFAPRGTMKKKVGDAIVTWPETQRLF